MKINKLLVLVITFYSLTGFSNAQNVRPLFKQLIIAAYRPNDSVKNLRVTMDIYIKITTDGLCNTISNGYNGVNYTGRVRDSIFRLPDSVITKLNNVFNGKRQLKSYMVANKLPLGANYAGPYEFITYTMPNDKTDSLIAVMGLVDKEFAEILDEVWRLPKPVTAHNGKIYHNKIIEGKIIQSHQICAYLPGLRNPPMVKQKK